MPEERKFSIGTSENTHVYIPATTYICTLSASCFEWEDRYYRKQCNPTRIKKNKLTSVNLTPHNP